MSVTTLLVSHYKAELQTIEHTDKGKQRASKKHHLCTFHFKTDNYFEESQY